MRKRKEESERTKRSDASSAEKLLGGDKRGEGGGSLTLKRRLHFHFCGDEKKRRNTLNETRVIFSLQDLFCDDIVTWKKLVFILGI